MHPRNLHHNSYDFKELIKSYPQLSNFVILNKYNLETIDFSSYESILALNKALLLHYYEVANWNIPANYLCPPIPGRADYIHYIADLINYEKSEKQIKGLDIGVGANCIYPILGTQIYNWQMVGADINENAVLSATNNIKTNEKLRSHITIRHQKNHANIFEGIIDKNEYYDFTMCNPPFHSSKEAASKGTLRKLINLHNSDKPRPTKKEIVLNFGGQANELWCNGGEALFIKRMIKQSSSFKNQVGWFTSLVSKKENLPKIYKQLDKLNTTRQTFLMEQGSKKSRLVAWKF